MTNDDFEKAVIQKSYEKPVVVDFWAPWCGPCRTLGPIIEQLAAAQSARWELVKINTEEAKEIAQTYRIMSIPNVKLFYEGKPIAEFTGALPKQHIMKWLDEHIPSEAGKALRVILAAEADQAVETTKQQLEEFIKVYPDYTEAKVILAEYSLYEAPERALSLMENIKLGDDFYNRSEDFRMIARLMMIELDEQNPVARELALSRTALKNGFLEPAITHLLEAVALDKQFEQELPRKSVIALFRTLGNEHELTKKYRRKFDRMLY